MYDPDHDQSMESLMNQEGKVKMRTYNKKRVRKGKKNMDSSGKWDQELGPRKEHGVRV